MSDPVSSSGAGLQDTDQFTTEPDAPFERNLHLSGHGLGKVPEYLIDAFANMLMSRESAGGHQGGVGCLKLKLAIKDRDADSLVGLKFPKKLLCGDSGSWLFQWHIRLG
jgi:hypothetical protein